jgi:hypothetical protein
MNANEPGAAILAIFDQIINIVKQAVPVRSDNKPLGGGRVYSMLTLGMPVDPVDFVNPWTPQGDIASSVTQGSAPAAPAPAPVAAPAAGGATSPQTPPAPDPESARKLAAAYKTSVLCNTMLQVTTDGTYLEYPTGQHLNFAYDGIISAMQPATINELPDPQVQQAIDKAQRILYVANDDGTLSTTKSTIYKKYISNTNAYGGAVSAYAQAYASARSDPNQMQIWPVTSITFQNAVDQARDQLIADGAEQVEGALDTLASVGNPIQAHMVAEARDLYKKWDLGLTGAVPVSTPYSFIMPSGWADPNNDDEGWQTLTVDQSSYHHYDVQHATTQSQYSWFNQGSSSSGSGGVMLGFAMFGGSGSSSSSSGQGQSSSQSSASNVFGSDAKSLRISLSYALCTIERPWLSSDLFYMQGWYLRGGKKFAISNGQQGSQANVSDVSKLPILPMIPEQVLVIRDVKISTSQWGSAGDVLSSKYGDSQASSSSSSSEESGSGGVCLGFVSFGGSASHAQRSSQGQGSSFNSRDSSSYFGTTFDGSTLEIPGAQIIAWLSDIVPACPQTDDPELGTSAPAPAKPASAGTASTGTASTPAAGAQTTAATGSH